MIYKIAIEIGHLVRWFTHFEKKQVGRPRGSFEEKQSHYLKMLNEGRVKQPKSQTLEFYKIERDGEVYKLMDW